MPFDTIFRELAFRNLTVKNRIFRSNISGRFDNYDGSGSPVRINWEVKFARGGVGAIISSFVPVNVRGRIIPGYAMIDHDDKIPFWRAVGEAVHAHDCKFIMQLSHSGRQQDIAGIENQYKRALSSTSQTESFHGLLAQAMTREEIGATVEDFAAGARRAREAGLDGVELHGANGYLIDQFLRDGTNRRDDRYGGSAANRARFLLEVTEAAVAVWGADRVGVRLSPLGTFNGMSDGDPAGTFGTAVDALGGFGLAYLHLVEQMGGPLTPEQHAVLKGIRGRWHGPYVANGAYDAARGAQAVASGWATSVAYGVPFLANPDLPLRLLTDAELNEADKATFYGGDAKGYVDYPAAAEGRLAA
jgi:2,4-dienoyl-CoA reductase-like NADH-dependent reductase (Old Yellow Enzyme family)